MDDINAVSIQKILKIEKRQYKITFTAKSFRIKIVRIKCDIKTLLRILLSIKVRLILVAADFDIFVNK